MSRRGSYNWVWKSVERNGAQKQQTYHMDRRGECDSKIKKLGDYKSVKRKNNNKQCNDNGRIIEVCNKLRVEKWNSWSNQQP